ncbi:hypothetical protein Zm00014a_010757 [Zea mays]|uniref:Uncharacterized protein n=2 Tax=Zea mays TaxID=4577 RepID=A0A1D6HDN6_MAIZE|nr:hypothetical protein ZEAMMB73_Zm00001d017293 [Zea mays]AQK72795.1 hypothetical protein ZEAMMB73_Zm00001d017293 [Zea mays]PWZ21705.1 hypothetical protein Zm00014a_010757 [Zea mays]
MRARTWKRSPMLTTRVPGIGLTATQLSPFMSCRPPTCWSWQSTVRKSLSVCGTRPKAPGEMGHAGYRFSRRKHVVSSHPSGKRSPAGRRPRRASARTRASVPASFDIAPATSRVTSLLHRYVIYNDMICYNHYCNLNIFP